MRSERMTKQPSSNRRKGLIIAAAILVVGGGAWGLSAAYKAKKNELPKELSVESLRAKAADPMKLHQELDQAMSRPDLNEVQREKLRDNMHVLREEHEDQRINAYFAAPEAERKVMLDKQLDEMQAHMKEWQQRRAANPGRGATGEANRGPRDANRASRSGGSSGGSGGGGQASVGGAGGPRPGGPGGRGPRNHTQAERKQRSESRDPDQTVRRYAYMQALQGRAKERGIDMPFHGPGGPGGR